MATPAIAGGMIYIRTRGAVLGIGDGRARSVLLKKKKKSHP